MVRENLKSTLKTFQFGTWIFQLRFSIFVCSKWHEPHAIFNPSIKLYVIRGSDHRSFRPIYQSNAPLIPIIYWVWITHNFSKHVIFHCVQLTTNPFVWKKKHTKEVNSTRIVMVVERIGAEFKLFRKWIFKTNSKWLFDYANKTINYSHIKRKSLITNW